MNKLDLLTILSKHNIKYDIYEHPSLHTVEESKKLRGKIEGIHTKNLFLKNKKKEYFLFSCEENRSVDLKKLSKSLVLGNLSFAKEADHPWWRRTPGSDGLDQQRKSRSRYT